MRLFVQPCGDEVQFKRFEKTILQRVKIETLKGHLNNDVLISLDGAFPTGQASIWGGIYADTEKQRTYHRMGKGDILLFTRSDGVFAIGEIGCTFESESAAVFLWGRDESGRACEYLLAISQVAYHDIDGSDFNQIVGYEDSYVWGFEEVHLEKARKFLQTDMVSRFLNGELLGSSPPVFRSGPSPMPTRGVSMPPSVGEVFDERISIWNCFGGEWSSSVCSFLGDGVVNVFSDDDGIAPDIIDLENGVIEFCSGSIFVSTKMSEADKLLENARNGRSPIRFWHRASRGKWVFKSWAVVEDRMKIVQCGPDGIDQFRVIWFLVLVTSDDPNSWSPSLISSEPIKLMGLTSESSTDMNLLLDEYTERCRALEQESAESVIGVKPLRRYKRRREARDLVLARAKNRCEFSGCAGMPFDTGRNGRSILEVDHIVDLALEGPDTPSNMIALCPNCHKAKTYGINADRTIKLFQNLVKEREAELGKLN
jgi:5-methylcytosine-specific restriction protein A